MKTYIYFIAVVFTFSIAGCSTNSKKADTAEKVKEEAVQAKKELKAEYTDAIQAVDKKIAGLESKLESETEEVKKDLTVAINELKKQRQMLAKEVAELSKASDENWSEIKGTSKDVLVTYQAKIDSLTLEAEEMFN